MRRTRIFAAGKNHGGLHPQARFGAQPPLAAALGAKMAEFTAQPLAALPLYGCGVPLAGTFAAQVKSRGVPTGLAPWGIKGHAENPYNNRCDEMAVAEWKKLK